MADEMTQEEAASAADHRGVSTEPELPQLRIVQRNPLGRIVVAIVAVLVVIWLGLGLLFNPNLDWSIFVTYVFAGPVIAGLRLTLELSCLALILGLVLGTLIAVARLSPNPVSAGIAAFYVWLLRGLPVIVQLLFWGNVALFVRQIPIGIPFTGPVFYTIKVSGLITPFAASVIGLGLAESAYMSEIIRGGIISVEAGQFEASAALGMGKARTMLRIVLPQAMRAIIPALGNQFSNVVKASALVSVIAGGELLTTVQNIAAENYRIMEMLFVASFWYLVTLAAIALVQSVIERRMRRSER